MKKIRVRAKEIEEIRRPKAALIRTQLIVASPVRAITQRPSFCALLKAILLDWVMNLNAFIDTRVLALKTPQNYCKK